MTRRDVRARDRRHLQLLRLCVDYQRSDNLIIYQMRANLWHGRLEVETRQRVRPGRNELREDADEPRACRRRLWRQRHLQFVLVVRDIARRRRGLCRRGRRSLWDGRRGCCRGCTEQGGMCVVRWRGGGWSGGGGRGRVEEPEYVLGDVALGRRGCGPAAGCWCGGSRVAEDLSEEILCGWCCSLPVCSGCAWNIVSEKVRLRI